MWLAQDDNSSNSLVVGWVTLAVFSVGSLLSSLGVVKYYGDRHDSHPLTTTVAVLSLSCTLMCVLAVPIDILNVGSFVDATTGQLLPSAEIEHRETAIRQLYSGQSPLPFSSSPSPLSPTLPRLTFFTFFCSRVFVVPSLLCVCVCKVPYHAFLLMFGSFYPSKHTHTHTKTPFFLCLCCSCL
eukprot:c11387_g1_i4.p1 GENE.c11387_g1_i4~~c11387_g1_i4.p1  ORF type:complete len:202 (-),score=41.64 c11387_g1_i4:99-647(-)